MAKVRGVNQVNRGVKLVVDKIKNELTERAVTAALIIGQAEAATITPIDTSFLINSQYRSLKKTSSGWSGRVGYKANYALSVHDSKGSAKGKNIPRDKTDPSRGNYWDPDGEPEFLRKGFERNIDRIRAAIKREMSK